MPYEAGSVVARFTADVTGFKKGISTVKQETGTFGKQLGSVMGVATKFAGVLGLALGGKALIDGLKSSVSASIKLENALLGLQSVARALGVDMDEATKSAEGLAEDGLMTIQESAEGLKNLLATGFSLPEAINLMNTFKDAASFNRQGTLAFGEAIVGATQGLKNQNSIMVDNVGITKNLSNILEEAGLSQDDLSRVTSDASVRQKMYNGLLKEGALFQGDAGRLAKTTGGTLGQLSTIVSKLAAAVGNALSPAVQFVAEELMGLLGPALGFVGDNSLMLQTLAIDLAASFMILGKIVVGVAKAMVAVFSGNFSKLKDIVYETVGGIQQTVGKANDKIDQAAAKSYGNQEKSAVKSFNNQAAAHSKKSAKIAKDLEDETRKFKEEMEKREKDYKEKLGDLINAHLDKKNDLEKDIADENRDFNEKMTDRTASFAEKMEDMKASHEEKVAEIMAQIEEETAKGEEADAKKVADLQARLEKENAEYEAQKAKDTARELETTAREQRDHDERLAAMQASLNEENEILKKHESDVATVKNQAKEDDITRLKRQFEEENQQATEEHARRMDEIAERGDALGDTLGSNINSGLAAQKDAINNTMGDISQTAAETMTQGIAQGAKEAGEELVKNFVNGILDKAKSFVARAAKVGADLNLFGPLGNVSGLANALRGFSEGGTIPGVGGEPKMIMAHAGERIIPRNEVNRGTTGGLSIVVSLEGATILDEFGAQRMGEKVGDSILRKLNTQLRY